MHHEFGERLWPLNRTSPAPQKAMSRSPRCLNRPKTALAECPNFCDAAAGCCNCCTRSHMPQRSGPRRVHTCRGLQHLRVELTSIRNAARPPSVRHASLNFRTVCIKAIACSRRLSDAAETSSTRPAFCCVTSSRCEIDVFTSVTACACKRVVSLTSPT